MRNKKLQSVLALLFVITILLSALPVSGRAETTANTDDEGSGIIVSLGDSFSSGEGIPPFYGSDYALSDKVTEQDWLAHRSKNSWPGMLELDGVTMSESRNNKWYFVATSGAVTTNLQSNFKKTYYKRYHIPGIISATPTGFYSGNGYIDPQINIFNELNRNGQKAEYVTFTMGGNDADFSKVVTEAVKSSTIGILNPSSLTDKLNDVWTDFYADGGIRDDLRRFYLDVIEAAGPQAKIIVAGYPKLINADGNGIWYTKDAATEVNDSVSRFNDEIEALVNSVKAEGNKICFVSVEKAFEGKEADSGKDACINSVMLLARSEDLDDRELISSYSMHPNDKGAALYAKCVQDKIDQIEQQGEKSEWPDMGSSEELDVVLVLDGSGSMDGEPIQQTKEAAKKFVETILQENASVGVVSYDDDALKLSDFCMNQTYLENCIQNLNAGGGTNLDAGLAAAQEMLQKSTAKKKIIVLMSDGIPNRGRVGDELIDYATTIKDEGTYIYTLGFFNNLNEEEAVEAQALMDALASQGYHYEVDSAENLVPFFGDVADQIQGTRYIYIRIACPVDVTVTYNDQTLSSEEKSLNQRTDFGTLTFEENPNAEVAEEGSDTRIKILRLKEGAPYKVRIDGNGKGTMNYTIGFMDENGEYTDMRTFSNIKINKRTKIETIAAPYEITVLKVDDNGDGKYENVYRAKEGGKGRRTDCSGLDLAAIIVVILIGALVLCVVVIRVTVNLIDRIRQKRTDTTPTATEEPAAAPIPQDPVVTPVCEESSVPTTPTFCINCGSKLNEGVSFCPNCGTPVQK